MSSWLRSEASQANLIKMTSPMRRWERLNHHQSQNQRLNQLCDSWQMTILISWRSSIKVKKAENKHVARLINILSLFYSLNQSFHFVTNDNQIQRQLIFIWYLVLSTGFPAFWLNNQYIFWGSIYGIFFFLFFVFFDNWHTAKTGHFHKNFHFRKLLWQWLHDKLHDHTYMLSRTASRCCINWFVEPFWLDIYFKTHWKCREFAWTTPQFT